jgi:hypothetical protein
MFESPKIRRDFGQSGGTPQQSFVRSLVWGR